MKKILKKLYEFIYSKNLDPITEKENNLILELRNEVKNIELINLDGLIGAELEWSKNVNDIISNILNKDPREFLSWEVIRYTMFIVRADYINIELKSIFNSIYYNDVFKNSLTESAIGKPLRYWKFPKSSANLIHHIYHLSIFKKVLNGNLNELDIVFEFGGGYGSMCRAIYNCNFNKKYIIFDLPVFSAIQKFYLKLLGIRVLSPEEYHLSNTGVICISDFDILIDITNNLPESSKKLFIATWSFSETPLDFRKKFIPLISKFNYHLIAYQKFFNEVNNNQYFDNFKKSISEKDWIDIEIEHLVNNNYLIGSEKK